MPIHAAIDDTILSAQCQTFAESIVTAQCFSYRSALCDSKHTAHLVANYATVKSSVGPTIRIANAAAQWNSHNSAQWESFLPTIRSSKFTA